MEIKTQSKKDGNPEDIITITNENYEVNISIKKAFGDVVDQNKNFVFGKEVMMMIKALQRSSELRELLMTHGSRQLEQQNKDNLFTCDIDF